MVVGTIKYYGHKTIVMGSKNGYEYKRKVLGTKNSSMETKDSYRYKSTCTVVSTKGFWLLIPSSFIMVFRANMLKVCLAINIIISSSTMLCFKLCLGTVVCFIMLQHARKKRFALNVSTIYYLKGSRLSKC